jgi:hypothetical protein
MSDEAFSHIEDMELMKLFEMNSVRRINKRAKQVRAELARRGYLYDSNRRDFVTCEEWNTRYFHAPLNCDNQAKKLGRD